MNQINIIAVTDIEHSSPRITNLLYYLDNKKFNKYIVGSNHTGFISKHDLPNNFFQNITYMSRACVLWPVNPSSYLPFPPYTFSVLM